MTPIIDRRRAALDARERDRALRRLSALTHRPGDHRQWKTWSAPEPFEIERLDDATSRGPEAPPIPITRDKVALHRESDPAVMLSLLLVSGAVGLITFLAGFLIGRLT